MERLSYIDAHGVEVPAGAEATWRALVDVARRTLGDGDGAWLGRALRLSPASAAGPWSPDPEPGTALPGFAVDRVEHGELLSLRGGHRFARYRLDFELTAPDPDRSHLWARTWADFPGPSGLAYRTLVIGTGAHRLVVNRLLHRIAARATRPAEASAA